MMKGGIRAVQMSDYPLGEEPPEVAWLFLHVLVHPCFHGDVEVPHIF